MLFSDDNSALKSQLFILAIQNLQEERQQRLKREARLEELRKNLGPSRKVKRKRVELEEKFDELFKDAPKDLHEKIKVTFYFNCDRMECSY